MNKIDATFQKLRSEKSKAFIAYLTVGFPDLETNLKLILEMERRGVDIIELGVPFSDPIADGLTIQASSQAALEQGTTPGDALRLASEIRSRSSLPLVLMGYLNPFLSHPPERLAGELSRAGIDGVIIPDLPPEESDFILDPLKEQGIHTISLLAPTSGIERIKLVSRKSGGFIYYVSRTGVTGARKDLSKGLVERIIEIKKLANLPVCVGFGISTRSQLLKIWEVADGVVIGSALIRPFLESSTASGGLKKSIQVLDRLLGND
ncbi:MAG: tryptophan synthase subunit alpha [Candidatus Euphemobacter frigidus]|nr:tryptophan synthase subunit alpha [Candidatus Euphemobacter frigidus]MDP8276686.1 tryptophan synthase subunit alpha [Candidatus Euphemobacter frigidus]